MDRADWQTVLQVAGLALVAAGLSLQIKWRREDRKRREDDEDDGPGGRHRR